MIALLMASIIPAASSAGFAGVANKVVKFPEQKSVGSIVDMGVVARQLPGDIRKYPTKLARGVQVYPADHSLHLELNYHGASDLSWLDRMDKDALASIDFNKLVIKPDDYKYLARLDGLSRIILINTEVGDKELEQIAKIKNLKDLSISKTNVTGTGLKYLSQAKSLKRLDLSFDPLSEIQLKAIGDMSNLETLFIANCSLTNGSLYYLAKAPRIRRLALGFNKDISDNGVELLARFPRLAKLEIQGTSITYNGLVALAKRRKLASLRLSAESFSEQQLNHLRKLMPGCDIKSIKSEAKIEPDLFAPLH